MIELAESANMTGIHSSTEASTASNIPIGVIRITEGHRKGRQDGMPESPKFSDSLLTQSTRTVPIAENLEANF
jgi:hypothetical protein